MIISSTVVSLAVVSYFYIRLAGGDQAKEGRHGNGQHVAGAAEGLPGFRRLDVPDRDLHRAQVAMKKHKEKSPLLERKGSQGALNAESPVTTALPMVPFSLAGMSFGMILEAKDPTQKKISGDRIIRILSEDALHPVTQHAKRNCATGMWNSKKPLEALEEPLAQLRRLLRFFRFRLVSAST